MFLCPAGWHEWRAGDALLYTPRQGRTHCIMTYREQVTPIKAFPDLVLDVLLDDAEFTVTEKNKITRFLTDEGEYAALIVVKGHVRGRPIAHAIAAVFADHFTTCLDARIEMAYVDEYAELALDSTKANRLELGVRRRRVGFVPPPGWHPIPGLGLEVAFLPPEYPQTHAAITVYPAQPAGTAIDPHAYQNLHDVRVGLGAGEEGRKIAVTGTQRQPLHGEEWHTIRSLADGARKMERFLVVLRDERYLYVAKLEAFEGPHVEALHRVFADMVGTFEPIPQHIGARSNESGALDLWSE